MIEYPFFVNNFDRVKNYRKDYPLVGKIFEHPVSFWYGVKNGQVTYPEKSIKRLLKRAAPSLPVFTVYNLPNRDMGQYSKGGVKTGEGYLEFIDSFCKGISGNCPIVIYEPDALPHLADSTSESTTQLGLMKTALRMLSERTGAIIYIDIGHSNWLSVEQADNLLSAVGNSGVRGFALNTSNYRSTEESMNFGLRLCEVRPNDYFVIDTSRNGNGPFGNEWCNPPGRALGIPPTCNTHNEKCDAFLWAKVPGESDGTCNGGPRAGRFWPEQAEKLISASKQ